jgi:hypothetical protein
MTKAANILNQKVTSLKVCTQSQRRRKHKAHTHKSHRSSVAQMQNHENDPYVSQIQLPVLT